MNNYIEERERLICLFEEQRNTCEQVSVFTDAIVKSRNNSVVFVIGDGTQHAESNDDVGELDFVHADIKDIAGAVSQHGRERAALLVGLSRRHMGGGVIRGQITREAEICRQSTLYYCLCDNKVKEAFYEYEGNSFAGGFRCVYFPEVLIYKDRDNLFKEEALHIDVIGVDLPEAERDAAGEDVDINEYTKALRSCAFMMREYLKDLGIDTLII